MNLFIITLIGTAVLSIMPFNTREEKIRGKQVALGVSMLAFLETIRIWIGLEWGTEEFQFLAEPWSNIGEVIGSSGWGPFGAWAFGGVDGISIFYLVLTGFLIPICILVSWDSVKIMEKQFLISLLVIEALLFGVFMVLDLLAFYVLFEGVLIPMYLIIGVWGSREQKIGAAYYFFFYTLIGSVLMLLSILTIYQLTGTTNYIALLDYQFSPFLQKLLFLGFFASLAVKIPMFPFHIWLPLAHVEAPVAGSVLLAGILIKLGSYGFVRFTLPLFPEACVYFTPLIFTLATLAIIYASLTTLRQTDLKRIIAYSSVSHMAVIMLAIFSLTVVGIEGSIYLQIAHGIVSSALFIIVTVLYDRHHTRLVKYYRGVTVTMPLFSIAFLILTLANIAVPLSCNFIGEVMCFIATFTVNTVVTILASTGMVLSACYALFLYNRVSFGAISPYLIEPKSDLTRREWSVLLPMLVLTVLLGVFPDIILEPIHASVINLIG